MKKVVSAGRMEIGSRMVRSIEEIRAAADSLDHPSREKLAWWVAGSDWALVDRELLEEGERRLDV